MCKKNFTNDIVKEDITQDIRLHVRSDIVITIGAFVEQKLKQIVPHEAK